MGEISVEEKRASVEVWFSSFESGGDGGEMGCVMFPVDRGGIEAIAAIGDSVVVVEVLIPLGRAIVSLDECVYLEGLLISQSLYVRVGRVGCWYHGRSREEVGKLVLWVVIKDSSQEIVLVVK